MKTEIWKPVVGYESHYEVSNLARIRSIDKMVNNRRGTYIRKGIIRGICKTAQTYKQVTMYKNGKAISKSLHRMVALAHIPNPENKPQVNHIDGDKLNNVASNLEWSTPSENAKHSYRMGLSNSDHCRKPVIMLDKECNPLLKFDSCHEAARITGYQTNNISLCARGERKTHGGYRWQYI